MDTSPPCPPRWGMARSSSRSLWTAKLRDGLPATTKKVPGRVAKSPTKAMTATRGAKAIILGIDPSLRGTGLAVVDTRGSTPRLLASLTLKLAPKLEPYECLGQIADGALAAGQRRQRAQPARVGEGAEEFGGHRQRRRRPFGDRRCGGR